MSPTIAMFSYLSKALSIIIPKSSQKATGLLGALYTQQSKKVIARNLISKHIVSTECISYSSFLSDSKFN
jgi:hypothetical protein